MGKFIFSLITFGLLLFPKNIQAIVDPLASPNNRFGIHIISATVNEASEAASLVNSSGGDWGYITVLIEDKDLDKKDHGSLSKWQEFFNELRRRHLIPLVRIATHPVNSHWEKPSDDMAEKWAEFLDNLNWPTKNRYVIIYNEPNHGKEWGQFTDPPSYAKILNSTISELKKKSDDFFVLNAGFDASAPHQPPNFYDQYRFMQEMEKAVPGIFNKLDGFVSHSYPNPGFVGSPSGVGRGTVRTWYWELQVLRELGVTKNLPVFITETGWRHAEGINYDPTLPSTERVADYFLEAFSGAWNNNRIVAVTPFLLNYQEPPFDHFSFKKIKQNDFYPQYQKLVNLSKTSGKPSQDDSAKLTAGSVYNSIALNEVYEIPLTFKNTGQKIWGDGERPKLLATKGGSELAIDEVSLPENVRIEPNQEYTFNLKIKGIKSGTFDISLVLINDGKQINSDKIEFTTEVKSPVLIRIKAALRWKNNPAGEYLLKFIGIKGETSSKVTLNQEGQSEFIEAHELLPDQSYDLTLEKEFYQSKKLKQTVRSGENIIDFGTLEPNFVSVILNPQKFWGLLPFSN